MEKSSNVPKKHALIRNHGNKESDHQGLVQIIVYNPVTLSSEPSNVGKAAIKGIQLKISTRRLKDIELSASIGLLDTKTEDKPRINFSEQIIDYIKKSLIPGLHLQCLSPIQTTGLPPMVFVVSTTIKTGNPFLCNQSLLCNQIVRSGLN